MKRKILLSTLVVILMTHKSVFGNSAVITADDVFDLEDTSFFHDPIDFTPTGCRCFFRHRLNHPRYITDFLPQNFSHIIDFLSYSTRTQQDSFFVQAVFDIFTNKMDGVVCVSSDECAHFFKQLPELLAPYFIHGQRNTVKQMLWDVLINNRQAFDENPEDVIEELVDRMGEQSELRRSIMLFVKSTLSKVMWRHQDGVNAWRSFVMVWQALSELRRAHIIEYSSQAIEDINSLQWTLVHRFAYFIDLFGSELPADFYQKAREELNASVLPLLDADECEENIMNKREIIDRSLFMGDIKAQARQQYGIVSEDIVPINK